MSKNKNGRLGLCGAENSKCNHMMTMGFKGLNSRLETLFHTLVPQHSDRTPQEGVHAVFVQRG